MTPTEQAQTGTDRIEKRIALKATRARVWRALTVVESGFDRLPASRRASAFRSNDSGWAGQLKNIERHVANG